MTLSNIKAHFFPGLGALRSYTDAQDCALIVRAIPTIKLIARTEAADYYECDAKSISQKLIQDYLTEYHEFDAIDISYIVATIRKENTNG